MGKEKISIDDLLSRQSGLPYPATIKPTAADRVVVTPVAPEGKCACEYSITVEKTDVAAVSPTGDVRTCCGERLLAVEVEFTNVTVAEIFRQLSVRAVKSPQVQPAAEFLQQGKSGRMRGTFTPPLFREDSAGSHEVCYNRLMACMNSCSWLSDSGACMQYCMDTFRLCQILDV